MRLPSASQTNSSRHRIANVGSLDCRDLTKLPRRRPRYDRIRDDEGKVSVVDYPSLFSFMSLHPFPSRSHPDVLSSPSSFTFLLPPSSRLSYVPSTYFSTIHPLSFLLPSRVSMRTRDPAAIPFLRFSHFNATSVRLRHDTYYTPRPHDNTVDNGNDGCTSLFMPPLPQPTFCLFAVPLPPGRTFLHRLSRVRTFEMSEEC